MGDFAPLLFLGLRYLLILLCQILLDKYCQISTWVLFDGLFVRAFERLNEFGWMDFQYWELYVHIQLVFVIRLEVIDI